MTYPLNSVTAFGDSIMKGVVLLNSTCQSLPKYSLTPNSFARRCEQKLNIRIENFSKFGGTVRYGLEMVKKHEEEIANADYAVFEYGGNDCDYRWNEIAETPEAAHLPRTTLPDFRMLYRNIIDFVKSKGTVPVLMSLPVIDDVRFFNQISRGLNRENILKWLGGATGHITNWHEMYNIEVFRLAREKRVPIIDITTPFLERTDFREYLCDDGMHPNEKGHLLIAETVNRYIASLQTAYSHIV